MMSSSHTISRLFRWLLALTASLVGCLSMRASVGGESFVTFAPAAGAFSLVEKQAPAPLVVDAADWPGVRRAASDLQADVERVTAVRPELANALPKVGKTAVLIGTIGRSKLVDELIRTGKIDASGIVGRWEAYLVQVVEKPLPGLDRALVIAGSDKRGAIYGIYELSEQIGVSPWYWWADVPVVPRDALYVTPGRHADAGPVVRYRGIFLNDEAPSLSGWAQEKFGGCNSKFYSKVFELLLRLRANYLWPAMWPPRAFNDDDPENARLADEYGIVMGTSHHEPMMRAHDEWARYGKGPWNYSKNADALREFWRSGTERVKNFEKIVTVGMRGDGDEAMSEDTNVGLLERIVADQRALLAEIHGKPASEIPQLWALYKEVQGYYERGMRVPDDVTLLWCDDNWGNIRRLPTPSERKRSGGAGVYYHFDYVGGPRNYKWINVTPLPKIWEQMHLAWQNEANRIWIVNVGDLKPMEFPIEFFLTYAWNPAAWPYERLDAYSRAWATREFGADHAAEVASLINGYSKLNRRRTPEMQAPDTYSLVHYREAERVMDEWNDLVRRAEALNSRLAPEYRDAFFQLVLYPVKASAGITEINIAAGLNKWYAVQGRTATNTQAARVRALFAQDAAFTKAYHSLNGGKWNHQMDQIKLGYTYWQSPATEVMPAIHEVRPNQGPVVGFAVEGIERGYPVWAAPPAIVPSLDRVRRLSRWVEIFNRGDKPFSFTATPDQPWLKVSPAQGTVEEISKLEITADWAAVPADATKATLKITTSPGESLTVTVPVAPIAPEIPPGTHVEVDRHVAIEALHYTRAVSTAGIEWKPLANFGRGLGAVTTMPVLAPDQLPGGATSRLEYDVWFASTGEMTFEFHLAPSIDFHPGEGLRFGVSLDDEKPQILKLGTAQDNQTLEKAVGDSVRKVSVKLPVNKAGLKTLKYWYATPGVVLERIVIDAGGVKPSYLGPVESPRIPAAP